MITKTRECIAKHERRHACRAIQDHSCNVNAHNADRKNTHKLGVIAQHMHIPTLEVLAMINDQKRIYSRQAQFMYVAMQHIPYLSKHPL